MSARETTSIVPFVVVVALVLGVAGYFGWRAYASPVDEVGAGLVATRASEVVVRAGGGDARVCENMRDIAAPDEADATVRRCGEVAALAASVAPVLGARDLRPTKVDVGRQSGTVRVSGTLLTPSQSFPLSITWPVRRVDGAWVISGGPDAEVG